jgi:hypothetical protein
MKKKIEKKRKEKKIEKKKKRKKTYELPSLFILCPVKTSFIQQNRVFHIPIPNVTTF